MKINTDITNNSWSGLSKETAKTYLHYYPNEMKIVLSKFISSVSENPKVLDIGCGNGLLYPILKDHNKNLEYVGVDIADNLLEVAREVVGEDGKIIKGDIFDYMNNLNESFTFGILSHMLECTESPDLTMNRLSKNCEYIAIHWFDPPTYEFDSTVLANNPHSESEFRPYIRRKIGKDYWQLILSKNNLTLVHEDSANDTNLLEIYKKK